MVFRASPDTISISRLIDGNIVEVNDAFEKMFGITRENAVGRNGIELSIWPSFDHRDDVLAPLRRGEPIRDVKCKFRRASGEHFDAELSSEVIQFGETTCILSIVRDVSKNTRWSKALQRLVEASSSQFGESYNNSMLLEIASILNADYALIGTIADADDKTIKTVSTVVDGKLVENLEYELADTPCENVVGQDVCVVESGVADKYHKDVMLKDMGAEGYMGVPLNSSTGQPLGLIVILTREPLKDIEFTRSLLKIGADRVASEIERSQTEMALRESENKNHQIQKMESIGRLAGGIAHDLNNLLTPIIGYSELIIMDLSVDPKVQQSVSEVLHAGLGAKKLVQQLLAYSRKQTLQVEPININETLSEFEGLLRRTIRENIEIKMTLSSDVQTIMGDSTQIEQVIMNLAVNAADSMIDGGRMSIETSMVYLDHAYTATHLDVSEGEYVMLSVSDTGTGISKEELEYLFEPFYSTKGEQGTGLGLSTVYGIVKQHGGNIWVYSEVGIGSVFKVYLPVAEAKPIKPEKQTETSLCTKGTETVLLVEDYLPLRKLALTILERQGYTVLTAGNGQEALSVLDSHTEPLHLLLTDIVMPKMSGKELYDIVSLERPALKVIYMSGYSEEEISHHGVLDQDTAFIQKPFTIDALTLKVRKILG